MSTLMQSINQQWLLKERPSGLVEESNFEWRENEIPELKEDEILVKVLYLSFDPTQRGWLNDVPSYVPPVQIGEVMRAGGIGKVVATNNPNYQIGELVQGTFGWQRYCATKGSGVFPISKVPPGFPPTYWLSVLGITGLTAYFGMQKIAQVEKGDVVLVSGAAGATGSVAGQIAKFMGAKQVIGIAGGAEKCAWLLEAGFDDAIDYRAESVSERLKSLCLDGVNVYFDNVGGPILDEVLLNMAIRGRVALCGGISSGYGLDLPPGPKHYMQLVIRRCRMEGFLVLDYVKEFPGAIEQLQGWLNRGELIFQEDMQEGLENAPNTLRRLFQGKNIGKQLLRVASD
ncbi:MAG: NADP-dependent oxidoreductase [Pseudomonadales bacterium]|nr:NADP-dependent oxidoreductase [Pseudomonadales bacterium]